MPSPEFYVAIWSNFTERPNARPFMTVQCDITKMPVAFPMDTINSFGNIATTGDGIEWLARDNNTTAEQPLLVPLPLARSYLGWENFRFAPAKAEN